MLRRRFWLGLIGCLLASRISIAAPSPRLHLATLEWRPYVALSLPGGGVTSVIIARAAAQTGRELQVDYFPWVRAMKIGGEDPAFDGYFPSYFVEERSRRCYFSHPIGTSTVGLAFLSNAPIAWNTFDDLRKVRIGLVLGYSNGREFDQQVAENLLKIEYSSNDLANIRKLLAGRTQAIVIDQLVLRYLLATEPSLGPRARQILFHARPIAQLSLHVCFRHTAGGKATQEAFDQALQRLDLPRIESEYFEKFDAARK
ncbi:MAG: transporter substrate-binding domain-containing protein [Pseudomonadota bacterium]|nr:transporter substrate-binding domain-containing protein [Pseudomonadota bacterium]